jgi:outer membrane protein OmpA-like peptidoglycan-associated protein
MSENFIQVLKEAFTDKAIDAVGSAIGEDASKTKAGLGAIIPTVLGGILGRSANATTSPSWWQTIADMFGGDDDDDLKLGLLGDAKFGEAGKSLLGSLFGGNLDQIIGSVASAAGLNRTKAGSLLTTVAPMVIGFLSRWAKRKGLSFADLIGKLLENKSAIVGSLPAGLGAGLLGMKTDEPEKPAYDETTRKAAETKTVPPKFNWTWLLALLIALILLWLIFGRGCNRKAKTDELAKQTTEAIQDIGKAATDMKEVIKGALNDAGDWVYDVGATINRKLADGSEFIIGVNSVENRLLNFIEDPALAVDKETWFSFDRLYFETGKSTLKPESQVQLGRIAAIMKAYPKVSLKIGGYTDNTGTNEINMKLSTERAQAAMNELIKLGVAESRLAAEGYGSQYPVCPANDTPECRAQNRRIDVRVTAK